MTTIQITVCILMLIAYFGGKHTGREEARKEMRS
jgi:hypothetical protein